MKDKQDMTYLGTPAGELSLDQLRYRGLLFDPNSTDYATEDQQQEVLDVHA